MPDFPRVSVIMPVYNAEQYLRECLDSVTGQTLRDIEIICINDGSTDGSLAVLEEYASKDKRIKLISQSNSGYGHTMNVGLDNAAGEYIGIVESDDYVLPEMFAELYNAASKYNLDFVKSDFKRFYGQAGKRKLVDIRLTDNPDYYNRVIDPHDNIDVFRFPMNIWTGIYNREFLKKHNIRFNETPGASYQDNGFWFQTFCCASRVYFLNRSFYMVRRDNPNSSIRSREKVYCICEEHAFIEKFLNSRPELKSGFAHIHSFKKYHNYLWTYNRIAKIYRPEFLKRFSLEFKRALADGDLDQTLFNKREWYMLKGIIERPEDFCQKIAFQYKIHAFLAESLLSNRTTIPVYRFIMAWYGEGFGTALKKSFRYIFRSCNSDTKRR